MARPLVSISLAFLCWGCLGVEVGAGGTGSTGAQQSGSDGDRRTQVEAGSCDAWKIAYCDAVEACEPFADREACEVDVGYLRCAQSAAIGDCAERIDDARENDCSGLPSDCAPAAVADRTIPRQACEALHEAFCEWALFCGHQFSLQGCLEQRRLDDPCDDYTAVWPGVQQCLDDWAARQCDAPVPEVCRGILR